MAEAAAERLARYYDLDLADEPADFDLYAALAERTGGPVLELAVGTGRIAVPLAAAGRSVTGIDHDPATLARAERRWSTARSNGRAPAGAHLELVTGDLLRVPASPRFALSILAFNSLLLLETAERQAAAVRRLARHLRPAGLAVVDVWLPGTEDLGLYDGRLIGEW
ncbi:MAG TPA: class I SAM-dependent methyltransferase, partial [Candidatus Limnocylindrales bacterium]|nr:class I SAM-dependent methyltransferase [Candidatus Limnocylindrales bacterium]